MLSESLAFKYLPVGELMSNDDNLQAQDSFGTELAARRRVLSEKLKGAKSHDSQSGSMPDNGNASRDTVGLGQAMRLSSEFAAGVIAGSALGWLIDRFAGSSPWGLIVCTLLGFAAGIMNMMRASGLLAERGRK
jgi:ATP synthase protein I